MEEMGARNQTLKITVPAKVSANLGGAKEEAKFVLALTPSDFDLSWREFFQKHKNGHNLLRRLLGTGDKFTVMDQRQGPARKIWKLDSTITQFVDSFVKKLKSYKAVLGRKRANAPEPIRTAPAPLPQGTSRQAAAHVGRNAAENDFSAPRQRPPVTDVSNAKRSKIDNGLHGLDLRTSRDNSGGVGQTRESSCSLPRNPVPETINLEMGQEHEVASMRDSNWSQLDEVDISGVADTAVKANFLTNVESRLDNSMLVLIKRELKELDQNGKLVRVGMRIPRTMILLNLLMKDPPQ